MDRSWWLVFVAAVLAIALMLRFQFLAWIALTIPLWLIAWAAFHYWPRLLAPASPEVKPEVPVELPPQPVLIPDNHADHIVRLRTSGLPREIVEEEIRLLQGDRS